MTDNTNKTDNSLERRLAKSLAGRPLGCTEGRADDIAEEDEETLAELEHMRDVADAAYAALSDLAMRCHNRRNDEAWANGDSGYTPDTFTTDAGEPEF